MRLLFGLLVLVLGLARVAAAHEYWVEPLTFLIEPGSPVKADLRVGQDYKGSRMPFLSGQFQSFDMVDANGERPVAGTEGDRPAVNVTAAEGLVILAYHSKPSRLTFTDFEIFKGYVEYEGLDWAVQKHRDLGFSETEFSERYTRNAKALVQIGVGGGRDRAMGMPFELVVDGSPYAPGLTQVPVQLLWQGQPVAGWRINVFTRTDVDAGGVLTRLTTDADGRAVVPFPKDADILLNAVWLQQPDDDSGHEWESWWASMTFGRKGRGD